MSVLLVCPIQPLIIFSLAKAGDKCLAVVTLMMASRRQVLITESVCVFFCLSIGHLSEVPLEERRQRDHSSKATSSINTKMLYSEICSTQRREASAYTKLCVCVCVYVCVCGGASSQVKIIFLRTATKPGPLFSEDTSGFSSAICYTNTFS